MPILPKLEFYGEDVSRVMDDFSIDDLFTKAKKALSADAIHEPGRMIKAQKKWYADIFWDNKFFEGIFPLIKQQKPGKDVYVWIFLTQFIICLWIVFFFQKLVGKTNTISQQFNSNSLSSGMVITLFVMIFIMIIDRIIYATHTFLAFEDSEKQGQSSDQKSTSEAQGKDISFDQTVDYRR